jgi:hypothetical protein
MKSAKKYALDAAVDLNAALAQNDANDQGPGNAAKHKVADLEFAYEIPERNGNEKIDKRGLPRQPLKQFHGHSQSTGGLKTELHGDLRMGRLQRTGQVKSLSQQGSTFHDVDRQTAFRCFLVLLHHVHAGLAHGLDTAIKGNKVRAVAAQSQ